jgi:predicted ArsR family transcriptional regulator
MRVTTSRKLAPLSSRQVETLLVFDAHRRRIAGRRYRPTLRELGLELNISGVGARGHVFALVRRGLVEHTGLGRPRPYRLTLTGIRWLRAHHRQKKLYALKKLGGP